MSRYYDNIDALHSPALHLQGAHKFNSTYNSTLLSAKTRQALSLPTRQRQPSPQRTIRPMNNRQKVSSLLCPISAQIVPALAYKNNPHWSTYQSRMEEFMSATNQVITHSSNAMKPCMQNQSTGSIYEEKNAILEKQQSDLMNQQPSPSSIAPVHSAKDEVLPEQQQLILTNQSTKDSTTSSSFESLLIRKPTTKINAIVLAMINKKNTIIKQFMQHQIRPPLTVSQSPNGIQQQQAIALSKHIGQNKYCENLQSSPINFGMTGEFSSKQSQTAPFLFKNQTQQVDFKDEKKEEQLQMEQQKQILAESKEIFEFPISARRKQHIFLSSEKLNQSNSNTCSSTNTFHKQRQNNRSYQLMSATTLSRKNSGALQSQFYKIDSIVEPMRGLQEQEKQILRNSNSLSSVKRGSNFRQQTSLITFKQEGEGETVQISKQPVSQQQLGFTRRSQSAHQSRIRVDCSSSVYKYENIDNSALQFYPQVSQFNSSNKESNSHLSCSHRALKDEEESIASDQSSLKSWNGQQAIIDGGISIENSIENGIQADQAESKKDILADFKSMSKNKSTQKLKQNSQMRSSSSRLEAPLKVNKITVFSSPHGVKKTLCGWSFTNEF